MRESPWKHCDWWLATATLCGFAAVFLTAVLLARLPGATQPLSAWWTMATAIFVGGLAATSLELIDRQSMIDRTARLAGAIAASGVMSLAVLVTTRQSGPMQLALGCVLSVLFASTLIAWALRFRLAAEAETELPEHAQAVKLPDSIDQELKRYIADGRDHLEASVRVRFQAGQQTAIVHLPIQPPMAMPPEVEAETVDDADLRITVDPAQPYGIRLVCRRGAPYTETGEAVVAVLVTADLLANAAA